MSERSVSFRGGHFSCLKPAIMRGGDGRHVRYRFAQQKSKYVAQFLDKFGELPAVSKTKVVRDWLTQFNGIGPKTASWVVRNWFDSDDVAIIDVHLHRAGLLAGFFYSDDNPAKNYQAMERDIWSLLRRFRYGHPSSTP